MTIGILQHSLLMLRFTILEYLLLVRRSNLFTSSRSAHDERLAAHLDRTGCSLTWLRKFVLTFSNHTSVGWAYLHIFEILITIDINCLSFAHRMVFFHFTRRIQLRTRISIVYRVSRCLTEILHILCGSRIWSMSTDCALVLINRRPIEAIDFSLSSQATSCRITLKWSIVVSLFHRFETKITWIQVQTACRLVHTSVGISEIGTRRQQLLAAHGLHASFTQSRSGPRHWISLLIRRVHLVTIVLLNVIVGVGSSCQAIVGGDTCGLISFNT